MFEKEAETMKKTIWIGLIIMLTMFLVAGCRGTRGEGTQPKKTISVFAGAGLKEALPRVAERYTRSHPDVKISFNFAASGTLQKQIEQGAPADVFVCPGDKQLAALAGEKLVDDATGVKIVGDRLVLVVPKDSDKVKGFADLARADVGKIGIGAPNIVPAGEFAKEVLVNMGLWNGVRRKLVLAKDVQQVKAYVETGNVDAGLVYRSTAAGSSGITIVAEAPQTMHQAIWFKGAVVSGSREKETALDFLHYLRSVEASQVFTEYGFTPLPARK